MNRAWARDTTRESPRTELSVLEQVLAGARVEGEVFALRPDYRAVLLAVDGLVPGPSDTVAAGEAVIEHPDAGEVVWCDEAGVTCRRWNWRQGRRTRLREDTTTALFILDALAPMTDEALHAAAEDLATCLGRLGPDVRTARRLLDAGTTPYTGA